MSESDEGNPPEEFNEDGFEPPPEQRTSQDSRRRSTRGSQSLPASEFAEGEEAEMEGEAETGRPRQPPSALRNKRLSKAQEELEVSSLFYFLVLRILC